MTSKKFKQITGLTTLLALVCLTLTVFVWLDLNNNKTQVIFLDIGQGQSALIKTRNHQNILIDGGPDNRVLDRLGRNLSFFDDKFDLVVATHPDADHITGLAAVLEKYKTVLVLDPGVVSSTLAYKAWRSAIAEKDIPVRFVDSRARYDLGENLFLDVLYPDKSFAGQDLKDNNVASVVMKLTDGQIDYLFTGDANEEVEKELVNKYGSYVQSEILQVAHHGSKTSSSETFLDAVRPEATVIQVGRNNRYHHPSPVVLKRIKDRGLPIFRNDERGDIKFVSNGEQVELQ